MWKDDHLDMLDNPRAPRDRKGQNGFDQPRPGATPNGGTGELFGDYLARLLRERRQDVPPGERMTATRLAEVLGVDASLVHHWSANRRLPQPEYIERIATYLDLTSRERRQLHEAYTVSAQAKKSGHLHAGKHQRALPVSLLLPSEADAPDAPVARPSASERRAPLPTVVETISGTAAVIDMTARLLLAAPTLSDGTQRSLYMTHLRTKDTFGQVDLDLQARFQAAVRQALIRGWDVRAIVLLDRNVWRTLGMVEQIQAYLGLRGHYERRYLPHATPLSAPYSLCVVPTVGTLLFVATQPDGPIDSAVYFPAGAHDKEIELFAAYCQTYLERDQSSPLLEEYANDAHGGMRFLERLAAIDDRGGERFQVGGIPAESAFVPALSALAAGKHRADVESLATQVSRAFHHNLETFPCRHICAKGAIQGWLHAKGAEAGAGTLAERRDHIRSVIRMLEEYPNFELGLVDAEQEREITHARWQVVNDAAVVLDAWRRGDQQGATTLVARVVLPEPALARAYNEYAQDLWQRISPRNRDREYVIWWLERQVEA